MAVDGTYDIEVESPIGKRPGKLELTTTGNTLNGTYVGEGAQNPITNGTVSGDEFAFSSEVSTMMGRIKLEFRGKVTGDEISGQVQAGTFGSFSFKGTRV